MRPSDASRPGTSGSSIARRSREEYGEDGGHLTLKVVTPRLEEGEGNEIHFRIKQTTQVKSVFCMKMRKNLAHIDGESEKELQQKARGGHAHFAQPQIPL